MIQANGQVHVQRDRQKPNLHFKSKRNKKYLRKINAPWYKIQKGCIH